MNPDPSSEINLLHQKLNALLQRQGEFLQEINQLRSEINQLRESQLSENFSETSEIKEAETPKSQIVFQPPKFSEKSKTNVPISEKKETKPSDFSRFMEDGKQDLEKFIGENLISKIGIIILIIGIGIGAKYAIDRQLISPLTRIILGYLVGAGLLIFALKLKKNYLNFSAVLLSGALAIAYFLTYFAFSLYGIFSQTSAFVIMVIITISAVYASLNYNKPVIALIGLVGAYAVPFLLSNDSGKVEILFAYMTIINIGILIISLKKYWKSLFYSAFAMTWLIFLYWYNFDFEQDKYGIAMLFCTVFFAIFYLTFLGYKLIKKEKFGYADVILLIINSFVFYAIGYGVLDNNGIFAGNSEKYLGAFTFANAFIHFIISVLIFKIKDSDKNIFYFLFGLGVVFLTIAVPVQWDGNWVTLLWTGEAVLLFWIGATKNAPVYEKISYPLMALAFFSLLHDWYNYELHNFMPIFNINFLTSLIFIAAFSFIDYLIYRKEYFLKIYSKEFLNNITICITAVLIFTTYYAFYLEIRNYFELLYLKTNNNDFINFKIGWLLNYSLFYVSAVSLLNLQFVKNKIFAKISLAFIGISIFIFLLTGFFNFDTLHRSYLKNPQETFNIGFRYVSYLFVIFSFITSYMIVKKDFISSEIKIVWELFLHVSILCIVSCELVNWLIISDFPENDKLALSILWGFYSLLLIILGIWKNKKHLRILAIVLFGLTLVKLFFYDISNLDTISKTIIFVSLGVLLLIISFLYNKYKHKIFD